MADKYQWGIHRPGADPEHDKIMQRRFGRDHERPCNRPEILTCAMPECQYADACQSSNSGAPLTASRGAGATNATQPTGFPNLHECEGQ